MKKIIQVALSGLLGITVAACSNFSSLADSVFSGSDVISVTELADPSSAAPMQKYTASIRLLPYLDRRQKLSQNKVGISTQRVIGMSGTDILVEPDVATIVTNSLRKRLHDAGFQMSSDDALYELSGVIKELNYDVRERDEIHIIIESTLKEPATGKVVWSGIVVEKSDRFAGVSGNNKKDIANYLRGKVGVVADKTTESISSSLMASRPDLFNLTPGTQAIAGVTVLVAPDAKTAPSSPQHTEPHGTPPAVTANGELLITSVPARAKIYIDGVYYGMTPLRFELAAGVHQIRAELAGHKKITEKVSVRKAETTEIDLEFKP